MQDTSSDNINVLLKEYEIVIQICENKGNAQNTLFIFALTAIGAILSFSLQQENPYIAMVSFPVLIAVRSRVMWFRDTILRDWVYLQVFVEPKLRLSSSVRLKSTINLPIANIHYWIYSILGIGAFATYMLNDPYNNISFIAMIIMLIIVLALDVYYRFWSKNVRKYYEEKFTKDLNEMNKEHSQCPSTTNNHDICNE